MIIFFIFLFGLAIGSFLNVVIFRLQASQSLFFRSRCQHCKKDIVWYDNIPIISFIILQGKCRFCKQKISWQYPMVELATGLLFVLTYLEIVTSYRYLFTTNNLQLVTLLRNWVFISIFIVIFVMDLRWYMIYDIIVLPSIIVAFFLNFLIGIDWRSMLLGGIIGGGFFLFQYIISQGKWIGSGDIRLGFLMGILLNWKLLLLALFLSYIFGAVIGLVLIAMGRKKLTSQIPFGTFLATGSIFALLFGENIIEWYFKLITFSRYVL